MAVIVTGGAKGIGLAIALKFAEEGNNIVLNYNSSDPKSAVEEIEKKGVKCLSVKCDISKFDEAKELIDKAKEEFGTIDVLVNNAGITQDGLIMRMKEEEFDRVIEVNLKGVFNAMRHVSNVMLKQKKGAIVNLSSVVGIVGNIGQANYAASKAGVIGMTKSCAKELASRGITCNCVAPGFIQTDMTDVLPEAIKEKMLTEIPLKSFGTTKDVAEAVYFLATNKYITGQVLNIDGGMVM